MSDHDLPPQGLLQQMSARSVSGEHLEVLGKRAAALWSEGRAKNLSEAVVNTVKTAGLSPEQVKRVVEFANTSAYLSEFHKEGSPSRVVDFGHGGLADPSAVLQDLNDGGGGSTYDSGSYDYHSPPSSTKTASADDEAAYAQMFASSGQEYPEANPLGEVIDLRDKLSSAYETATAVLSSLEVAYGDLSTRVFEHVKQAALAGHTLAEVVQVWQQVAPSEEHVKVAFTDVMPELVANGVFRSHEDVAESLLKHASVGVVDPTHPLVTDFREYCEVLSKLAETREAQTEYGEGMARLTAFLKEAADPTKGYWHQAVDTAKAGLGKADAAGQWVGRHLVGEANPAAKHFGTAAQMAAVAVPAVAAEELYRRNLKYRPTVQKAKQEFASTFTPTGRAQKDFELQAQYGGGGYPAYGNF